MKKIFFLFSIIVILSFSSALADHKVKSLELYPFISQQTFDGSTYLENTYTYGLRIGFNFSKRMEGEFLLATGETETNPYGILYVDPTFFVETPQLVLEDDEIEMWFFHFIYNFKTPRENLVPYVVAGAGRFRIIREFDIFDSETGQPVTVDPFSGIPITLRESQSRPAFTLGGGLRSYFKENFAFRFEVKAIQYQHDNSGLTYDASKLQYGFRLNDDDFINYEASLGISFLIGGKK